MHNIIRVDYWIKDKNIKNKIFNYIEDETNSIKITGNNNILSKDDLDTLSKSLMDLISKLNYDTKKYTQNGKESLSPYVDVFRKGDNALLSIRLEGIHPAKKQVI
ncbi:hypothetical protein [Apilactobacillus timberlakei]|uniref:hypothetical protein n=1 Tax=Apilactobacillus timberlakei TaxID=2008380 RepID=UPI001127AA26|nr:hypothetical protein [Apilactobacillus timberlakei]TPR19208.1 hypothetical protein DYZ95_00910 [Apilactobacillus timberlakei]